MYRRGSVPPQGGLFGRRSAHRWEQIFIGSTLGGERRAVAPIGFDLRGLQQAPRCCGYRGSMSGEGSGREAERLRGWRWWWRGVSACSFTCDRAGDRQKRRHRHVDTNCFVTCNEVVEEQNAYTDGRHDEQGVGKTRNGGRGVWENGTPQGPRRKERWPRMTDWDKTAQARAKSVAVIECASSTGTLSTFLGPLMGHGRWLTRLVGGQRRPRSSVSSRHSPTLSDHPPPSPPP